MKAHHRGWFTPFPPFFQYFGLSSKFKHLLLLLAKCSSIYFVYKSKVHRGRTYYIETLRRFLAFVSPPVQGGAKGGSLFHFQFSIFNCSSSSSIVPTSITFSPSRQIRKPEVVKSPVSTHTLDSTFRFAKMPLRCNALRTMAYF